MRGGERGKEEEIGIGGEEERVGRAERVKRGKGGERVSEREVRDGWRGKGREEVKGRGKGWGD